MRQDGSTDFPTLILMRNRKCTKLPTWIYLYMRVSDCKIAIYSRLHTCLATRKWIAQNHNIIVLIILCREPCVSCPIVVLCKISSLLQDFFDNSLSSQRVRATTVCTGVFCMSMERVELCQHCIEIHLEAITRIWNMQCLCHRYTSTLLYNFTNYRLPPMATSLLDLKIHDAVLLCSHPPATLSTLWLRFGQT